MESHLKPSRFDGDANSASAEQEWSHWITTFNNFLNGLGDLTEEKKFQLFINFVSPSIYIYI